jgi:hypothetical protein
MAQIVNRKNYVGISQPECRRKGCTAIDLFVPFLFCFFPGVRVYRVPTDKGFPYAIAL